MAPDANVREVVPFLRVADMAASLRFYVEGLDFTIEQRWADAGQVRWCRLQRGGAGLMLQDFRQDDGVWSTPGKLGEGVTLYFICDDALAIYREARANGLEPDRPTVGNGMWMTPLTDPDGYQVCFESDTDAPEDSEYVEDVH